MKLKINRDRLADIVTRGVSSAPKNSPSVIANNARIIARDGVLSIASTDFDMMVEASGECEMEHGGTTTVDAAKLKMTVDRLPKGVEVSFTYDDAKRDLIVKAGRSRVTFPTLAAEDWPARESKVSGAQFQLSGADLVRLFGHTSQALSNVPNSPMAGVFLHVREDDGRPVLAAVGTTGMILILATVGLPEGAENMPHREGQPAGVILSSETVNAVLRLFRAADVVNIEVDSSTILFTTDDIRFSSAMLVGTYPNYGPLVSNPSENSVLVDRVSCISTVSPLEPFASKELGHRLQCAGSDEGFVVAVGSQTGGGVDVVAAEIEGEVPAFGINGQFMKTMLNSFKTEIIVMHPDAHHRRVMFLAEGEPDLIGVIGMMNITTELAEGPKHE
ncbi:DNA-directed DNA polymerase [Bradyrhizobium retamae]|uniref:Beta sliding clamp n=1 Tax=Bradyrhizobium retamae TaxID=1300035 RepID=A0A0R3MNB8_9BRAD|nr:DNA-directed DNA polymerase [Bradyrhizobium retamae]KRR21657.1 DNA-directed DNA polymerase [Bradyrhizobium retamae]